MFQKETASSDTENQTSFISNEGSIDLACSESHQEEIGAHSKSFPELALKRNFEVIQLQKRASNWIFSYQDVNLNISFSIQASICRDNQRSPRSRL